TPDSWTISCEKPKPADLPPWCIRWCATQHSKELTSGAARLLVDLVGPEMGLLDQELSKLAIYVGPAAKIEVRDVDEIVGRRRAEAVWRIIDSAGAGQSKEALELLGQLLEQGEDAVGLLNGLGSQLRRIAKANRLSSLGVPLQGALLQAGVPNFP